MQKSKPNQEFKMGRVVGLVIAMVISLVKGYSMNDSLKTREYLALYQDEMKMDNYSSAMNYLEWLLENRPGMYKKFYMDAAKIYDEMARSEEDPDLASLYQEKVIWAYQERMIHFGEEAKVNNYLFLKSYQYYRDEPERYEELLKLFDQTLTLNEENVFPANILAYIDLLNLCLSQGVINEFETLNRLYAIDLDYDSIMRSEGKCFAKYEALTAHLLKNEGISCEGIEIWLKEKPEDFRTTELVNNLFIHKSCTNSEQYYLILHERALQEKNIKLIEYLARVKTRDMDFESALHLYEEATRFSDDPIQKSDLYLAMSKIELSRSNYLVAYQLGEQARVFHASPEVWSQLGDIFMNSYPECKEGRHQVYDRLCFIIAYSYYQKSGDKKKIQLSREQLPTVSMLFDYNLYTSDSLMFDCFIKRKVNLITQD